MPRRASHKIIFESKFRLPAHPAYPIPEVLQRRIGEELWGPGVYQYAIFRHTTTNPVPVNKVIIKGVEDSTTAPEVEVDEVLTAIAAVMYEDAVKTEGDCKYTIYASTKLESGGSDRKEMSVIIKEDDPYFGDEEEENDDEDDDDDDDGEEEDDDEDEDDDDDEEEESTQEKRMRLRRQRERMRDRGLTRGSPYQQQLAHHQQRHDTLMWQQTTTGMAAAFGVMQSGMADMFVMLRESLGDMFGEMRADVRAARGDRDAMVQELRTELNNLRTYGDNQRMLDKVSWDRLQWALDLHASSTEREANLRAEIKELEFKLREKEAEVKDLEEGPVLTEDGMSPGVKNFVEVTKQLGPLGLQALKFFRSWLEGRKDGGSNNNQAKEVPGMVDTSATESEVVDTSATEETPREDDGGRRAGPIRRRRRPRMAATESTLSEADQKFVAQVKEWYRTNSGYKPPHESLQLKAFARDVATAEEIENEPIKVACRILKEHIKDEEEARFRQLLTKEEWEGMEKALNAQTNNDAAEGLFVIMTSVANDPDRIQVFNGLFSPEQDYILSVVGVMLQAMTGLGAVPADTPCVLPPHLLRHVPSEPRRRPQATPSPTPTHRAERSPTPPPPPSPRVSSTPPPSMTTNVDRNEDIPPPSPRRRSSTPAPVPEIIPPPAPPTLEELEEQDPKPRRKKTAKKTQAKGTKKKKSTKKASKKKATKKKGDA